MRACEAAVGSWEIRALGELAALLRRLRRDTRELRNKTGEEKNRMPSRDEKKKEEGNNRTEENDKRKRVPQIETNRSATFAHTATCQLETDEKKSSLG